MTRKHFAAIAAIFYSQMSNPTVPSEARVALIANANQQADYFASQNSNFNRTMFLAACGMA